MMKVDKFLAAETLKALLVIGGVEIQPGPIVVYTSLRHRARLIEIVTEEDNDGEEEIVVLLV